MRGKPERAGIPAGRSVAEAPVRSGWAFSGLRLALFGALIPIVLVAAVVGWAVSRPGGGSAEVASRAGLDCTSSRDAWRWACQESKVGAPARDALPVKEAAARVKDPVTTGSIAAPKAARTAPAKTASAEPQPAMPAATAPQAAAAAKPEARPAPQPVASPEPATTGSIAPALAPATADDAKPSATAWVSPPGPTTPALAPPRPEPAPAAAAVVEPPRPVASSAPARSTVGSRADEPAVRRAVQARPEPIVAISAKRKVVASASVDERPKAISPERAKPRPVVEKPARVARHRPAPLAQERAVQADDDDDEPAASAPPLLRQSRLSARSDTGLRVSSVETRVMPDGRVMTVNVMPRPDVVRSLVARHTQSYASPRSRAPYWDW
jgi:hypothetical protein